MQNHDSPAALRATDEAKRELQEVLHLSVMPLLPDGAEILFTMRQAVHHDTARLEYIATHLLQPFERLDEIIQACLDITNTTRFDWCRDSFTFRLTGDRSSQSSHELIEILSRLSAIAKKNGVDREIISPIYTRVLLDQT